LLDAKTLLEGGKQAVFSPISENTKKQNESAKISVALSD
jgi:hypothetical protein